MNDIICYDTISCQRFCVEEEKLKEKLKEKINEFNLILNQQMYHHVTFYEFVEDINKDLPDELKICTNDWYGWLTEDDSLINKFDNFRFELDYRIKPIYIGHKLFLEKLYELKGRVV